MDVLLILQENQVAAAVGIGLLLLLITWLFSGNHAKTSDRRNLPAVPGLPVLGNLLQLKAKKPHKTFCEWAEKYGPIYSIRTGATTMVVLNNTQVCKEAMVTRFSSISTRKLSQALKILTANKCMVATSDYDDFHKTVKRLLVTNVLGANAQKRHRSHRDTLVQNVLNYFHDSHKRNPLKNVILRDTFASELYGLAMKEAIGEDVKSIYVDELGKEVSRDEIYHTLVIAPMEGAIEVDWRDFFPYLKWIPNKSWEMRIQAMDARRQAVMKALINQQKKRISSGEAVHSYIDYLLSEASSVTEKQLIMLLWEVIIEASDTTLVTTEWAMYELAKDPKRQDRLYREIRSVCGSDKVSEEHLPQLVYLNAVFHETLRFHAPVPVIPLRYVHEDTEIGGYNVPAGSEIAINLYGCNMDKNQWEKPDKWLPERFLDDEKYDAVDLFKTMAFGGGKRVCAGVLQAMLISCMAIARMIQEFEWRLAEGEEDKVDTVMLTTHKLYPLQAIIKARG